MRTVALIAVASCLATLKIGAGLSLLHTTAVVGVLLLLVAPLGALVTRWVLPPDEPIYVRSALTLGLGYALAPTILSFTARFGAMGRFGPTLVALFVMVGLRLVSKPPSLPLLMRLKHISSSDTALALVILVAASVTAVTPLMHLQRPAAAADSTHYAYIDSFFHANLVQRLMTTIPLGDWPNMAGAPPLFYQDFHHVLFAVIGRICGLTATETFFACAPVALVVVTVLMAFSVGTVISRTTVGGFIAASLQYIVLIPNVYDRNWRLANESFIILPNFYQIHFYNLRYAQHAASGWIVLLTIALLWSIALRTNSAVTARRATVAACCVLSMLFMFRPQYALMLALPAAVLTLWIGRRQPWLIAGGAFAGAASLALALYPYDRLGSSSAGLIIRYGVFAARISREGYFLPNAVSHLLTFIPTGPRATIGLLTVIAMRIIGLNLLIVILIGARTHWRTNRQRALDQPETYLWLSLCSAFLAALFLEQSAANANIGWNILQGMVAPTLLLATSALVTMAGPSRLQHWWTRRRLVLAALVCLSTLVAYRGAEALVHERPDRAYPLSKSELDAYAWIHSHTPTEAVVAADPEHPVNALGETIRTTAFLSGMTERATYVQYVSIFTQPESDRRLAILRRAFNGQNEDDVCLAIREAGADYWLEYSDHPFAVGSTRCLKLEAPGNPNVYSALPQMGRHGDEGKVHDKGLPTAATTRAAVIGASMTPLR